MARSYRHKTQVEYVRNTNGHATVADFVDDWTPVGRQLWNDLVADGMAYAADQNGTIRLTSAGHDLLNHGDAYLTRMWESSNMGLRDDAAELPYQPGLGPSKPPPKLFTKKHYNWLADFMHEIRTETAGDYHEIESILIDRLLDDNPEFNVERFVRAIIIREPQ